MKALSLLVVVALLFGLTLGLGTEVSAQEPAELPQTGNGDEPATLPQAGSHEAPETLPQTGGQPGSSASLLYLALAGLGLLGAATGALLVPARRR